ncbi:hypothetical protein J6590_076886 [Homalodisca vitripennis]|nr:hypothetical protein J6590_076886 [Homalodisca vitripennis]
MSFIRVADTDDDDTFNEEEARNYETIGETTVTGNIETPPNENESVITEILKEAEVPIVDQSQPIRDQEDRLNIMKRSFNLQGVSKQVVEDNEKLFCEPVVKLKKLKMSLSKEKPREASCHVTGSECVAHTDYYSIKTKHYKALTEISSKHYKHNIGRSRRNRPVSHGSRPHTDRFLQR